MKDLTDSLLAYIAVAMAWVSHLTLAGVYEVIMPAGSVILLAVRLYVDVPKALARWRSYRGVANGSQRS